MDFSGQDVRFREADRRFAALKRRLDAGSVSDDEFNAERQRLMVLDGGRWWAKLGDSGEWHYHDGSNWVRDTPPGYQAPFAGSAGSPVRPATSPSSPRPNDVEKGKNARRKVPLWIPVVGFGGIALLGLVLIFWVLVPYLRSGSMLGGAAFDAVFVHRATPENISANSTYLDDPQINADPNVVLYVTQNWNPEGSAGTYNDHPTGVWYDSRRKRWAIFNQDRKAMPEGAAFNVGVLKEPTETR